MLLSRLMIGIASLCVVGLGTRVVSGQDYPSKPIRIITSGIGGGNDFVARIVAQGISGPLGQQVIVDNRGGITGVEVVSKAPADGYTLMVHGVTFIQLPLLEKVPWDPLRDFSPITAVEKSPNVLVVHPSLPVKSVKELIALAKAKPGVLNYASGVVGRTGHLATELFKSMAGIQMTRISYNGSGPAVIGTMSGESQLTFVNPPAVASHVKSGRLRALAVTSLQPSVLAPGVPPIAATVPGYESISITGVFAPAKTPDSIINRLNQEIVRLLNMADTKERLFNAGIEVVGSSPQDLAASMKSDMERMGKLVKDLGLSP